MGCALEADEEERGADRNADDRRDEVYPLEFVLFLAEGAAERRLEVFALPAVDVDVVVFRDADETDYAIGLAFLDGFPVVGNTEIGFPHGVFGVEVFGNEGFETALLGNGGVGTVGVLVEVEVETCIFE